MKELTSQHKGNLLAGFAIAVCVDIFSKNADKLIANPALISAGMREYVY